MMQACPSTECQAVLSLIKKNACHLSMAQRVCDLFATWACKAIHFRDCRVEMALGRPFG